MIILIYIVFRIVTLLYTANASLETLEQTHCLLYSSIRIEDGTQCVSFDPHVVVVELVLLYFSKPMVNECLVEQSRRNVLL